MFITKTDRSKTYTKTEVSDIMQAKQNTLTFIYTMNLGSRVAGYPLLVGSNIIPGLSVQLPLTLTRNKNNFLIIGMSIKNLSFYIVCECNNNI